VSLTHYIVTVQHTCDGDPDDHYTDLFGCYADNTDHAMEQAKDAYPEAKILSVTGDPTATFPESETLLPSLGLTDGDYTLTQGKAWFGVGGSQSESASRQAKSDGSNTAANRAGSWSAGEIDPI